SSNHLPPKQFDLNYPRVPTIAALIQNANFSTSGQIAASVAPAAVAAPGAASLGAVRRRAHWACGSPGRARHRQSGFRHGPTAYPWRGPAPPAISRKLPWRKPDWTHWWSRQTDSAKPKSGWKRRPAVFSAQNPATAGRIQPRPERLQLLPGSAAK